MLNNNPYMGHALRFAFGIIMVILLSGMACAAPVEEWNRIFGGEDDDYVTSVQKTSNGYILGGYTSSYVSRPYDYDAWLIKTDKNGNELWNRTFGGKYFDYASSVLQTSDGYVLAGSTYSYGSGYEAAWLIKTDTNGNELWNRTFGSWNDESASSVLQTTDGYVLAGRRGSTTMQLTALLIKTDLNGYEAWNRSLGRSEANSVQQTPDGYIVAATFMGVGGPNFAIRMIKTDTNGFEVWNRTLLNNTLARASSVLMINDGYIVAGNTYPFPFGNASALLIKTDMNGNELWNKKYGGQTRSHVSSVQQIPDGYILAGSYDSHTWMIRTDINGNEVWNKTFGVENSSASSFVQTPDGYILAGSYYGYNKTDALLIKVSNAPITVTNPAASHEIPDDTDNEPLWGETAQLNVTATDDSGVAGVTVDLSDIGGSAAKPMVNIGGNIWSTTTNASAGTTPEIYNLRVNATNVYGSSNTSISIPLKVMKNGDTTGNGAVNIGDALLCANNVSFQGNPKYALKSSYVADVTGNGVINIGDALRLANNVSYPGNPAYILK